MAVKLSWSCKGMTMPKRSSLECTPLNPNLRHLDNNATKIPLAQERSWFRKRTSNYDSTLSFFLVSWNARSLNSFQKLTNVMKLDLDIACIQECWKPQNDILDRVDNKFFLNSRESNKEVVL